MKTLCGLMVVLLLISSAALADASDLIGFWYTEGEGASIELFEDGVAELRDEDGVLLGTGSYSEDGSNVTVRVGDTTLAGVVSGDSMFLNGGELIYQREEQIEFWISSLDNSALEFDGGHVLAYNEDGEVVGEGSYTLDNGNVCVSLDGKTISGEIDGLTMVLDGVEYSLL